MILIRILLIFFLLLSFGSLLKLKFDDGIRIIEKVIIIITLFLGILIIISPSIIDEISDFFNIGRAVDLILYFYMIFSGWFLIRSHIRINKLESRINNLVSYIALNSEGTNNKND
tara:strand:+ start:296 stop:640 length:345 start_codon:yes stop_codon:yes gene_type:complete